MALNLVFKKLKILVVLKLVLLFLSKLEIRSQDVFAKQPVAHGAIIYWFIDSKLFLLLFVILPIQKTFIFGKLVVGNTVLL